MFITEIYLNFKSKQNGLNEKNEHEPSILDYPFNYF